MTSGDLFFFVYERCKHFYYVKQKIPNNQNPCLIIISHVNISRKPLPRIAHAATNTETDLTPHNDPQQSVLEYHDEVKPSGHLYVPESSANKYFS